MFLGGIDMKQTEYSPEEIAFAKGLGGVQGQPAYSPDEIAFAINGLGSPQEQAEYTPQEKAVLNGLGNVLKNTGGAFMKGLEVMDRPRSMLVAGAQALKGDRPASDVVEAAKGNVHPSWGEMLPDMPVPTPSIKAGRRSRVDVDNAGKTTNVKHAVGMGLDMTLDPINLIGASVLTKGGKAAQALSNLAKIHGADKVDDLLKALLAKSPDAIKMLQDKGVSQKIIDLALSAKGPLAKTLPEQARAGQWAAAKFAGLTTPAKVNVPVAKAVSKVRQTLPKVPVINKFINRSGDDAWDEAVRALEVDHRARTGDIIDTGRTAQSVTDKLAPEAFGGKSSAAWYESEGGVWMKNLKENKFGSRAIDSNKQAMIDALGGKNSEELIKEGKTLVGDLMKKDFPEINGVKPYFAPGGSDKTFEEYVMHQLSGGKKIGIAQIPEAERTKGLYLAEDSISAPDFIFKQKNGNRFFGTIYDLGDNKDTLHVIITEMEKDGRVREITQYVTKNSSGHKNSINNLIKNRFKNEELVYLGDNVKNIKKDVPSGLPANITSSQHLNPGPGSVGDGKIIVNPRDEAVKLSMSQKITNLTEQQLADMKRLGIPVTEIDEAGYAYAPHMLTDEAAATKKKSGLFSSRNPNLPTTKTPHALHRDYKWITDPETGQEVIGSVEEFARKRGLNPDKLKTRNATVDEINAVLPDKFRTDLAGTVTEAAIRNERAIYGAEQLNFYLKSAQEDLRKVGGNPPRNWRRPRLEVPERFISKDGTTFPVRDKLTQLSETLMPPEKARMIEAKWKMVARPDVAEKQLRDLYKGYESAWKRYTLFMFPEYHSRNAVGDLWNGWMHGWQPHQIGKDLHDAARLQMTEGKGIRLNLGAYGNLYGDDVIKAAKNYGVIGTGQLSEIKDLLAPASSSKGKSIAKKIKEQAWDLKGPVAVGEALENNRRLGFFLRRLKEGDTYADAARAVANALYDYGDITPFEETVMKRVFPFYTYTRKNLPAQMENLIRHPGKVAALPKLKGAIEGAQEGNIPSEEIRPEWMRREFSIYTGKNSDGKEKFMTLGSYLPTTDLFKFGSSPEDTTANLLSNMMPPIKVSAELLTNRDFFRGRPVDQLREESKWSDVLWGNQRTNYLGQNMPTTVQRLSELLPITRALSTLDRLNPGGIFDQYPATEDGKTRPYHTELTSGEKWLKTLTGLKEYPVDMERDYAYRLKDLKSDNSKAPGLNVANVKAMARRAYAEGDMESYEYYMSLLPYISEKMDREMGLWETYTGKR